MFKRAESTATWTTDCQTRLVDTPAGRWQWTKLSPGSQISPHILTSLQTHIIVGSELGPSLAQSPRPRLRACATRLGNDRIGATQPWRLNMRRRSPLLSQPRSTWSKAHHAINAGEERSNAIRKVRVTDALSRAFAARVTSPVSEEARKKGLAPSSRN